ncbi:zinc finger family protein, putative [Ichthyophthirius multifiliis]|uniref:Zinc finger family protein, putative n=1 Tax=Ichthyophthirius multifiliis TaxID=5932 RepID=G0QQL0_ICHMU|nr:zinc finger family protein, putative [Ichthyophthirius multifiliis]EGR32494.1 zinc finger family protein, putative [Ichthyophthirius multifiliis]|eukprot:XP_004036480.1 zinc finger family protein, putative [Ichthyophthirius multifiliis]
MLQILEEYEETYDLYERDDDDDKNAYKTLPKKTRRMGNLNQHAIQYHAKNTVFLELKNGLILLVGYPKNIVFGNLYIDSFGQIPNPKNQNIQMFKIDLKLYNLLQDVIAKKKIPQEICYQLMKNSNILIDRDYI